MEDSFNSLDLDTPIYRIVDFFAFARMVEEQRLYVPQATAFSDENEGIDAILEDLVIKVSPFRDVISPLWKDHEEAIQHHWVLKRTHYITCWTRQVESVALWSLYSRDHCSVSIQTTARKLQRVLDDHWDSEGKQKILAANPGQIVLGISKVMLGPVQYRSLAKLHARIVRFGKAVDRLDKRVAGCGELLIDKCYQALREDKLGWSGKLLDDLMRRGPFLIKDESYAHESEVRGALQMGQAQLDEKSLNSVRELLAQRSSLHRFMSAFFKRPPDEVCPKEIYLKLQQSFIDAVRIDPRCPSHKADFIAKFAERNGIPVREAVSFGYLPRRIRLDFHAGAVLRSHETECSGVSTPNLSVDTNILQAERRLQGADPVKG